MTESPTGDTEDHTNEAAERVSLWLDFHIGNFGGAPNDRLSCSYRDMPLTISDLKAVLAALAAARTELAEAQETASLNGKEADNLFARAEAAAEAERDALAAALRRLRDRHEATCPHAPHDHCADHAEIGWALSGVGGNPTPAVEACALTHPHPAHPRLGPPCNGLRFHEIRADGVSGSPEGHSE